MSKRAVISVSNDLQHDQRVGRVCQTLHDQGYEVLLVGRLTQYSEPMSRPFKIRRFSLSFSKGFAFYAEFNIRLFLFLLKQKNDLLYSNDLDTLLPNYLVSRLRSIPLIYDSHEYFTEVPELIDRPRVRSFWLRLEKLIFPRLKNVIAVNKEIARIYSDKYGVPVSVVRNVPPFTPKETSALKNSSNKNSSKLKSEKRKEVVLIYQGALNLGRGIELMIDCMEFLDNGRLLIVGTGDVEERLKKRVKVKRLSDRVHFKGRIDPTSLKSLTSQASLGFSLEEDMGLNYRLALPNKIFDYIHAGVPVIVSDLPVMKKFVIDNKVGAVLKDRTPEALSQLITKVLSERKSYDQNLRAAAERFNWDKEKLELLQLIENLD